MKNRSVIKSLQDIQDEFFAQRREKDAELREEVRQAREKLDAVGQRAGISNEIHEYKAATDGEDRYRCRVREIVFKVPDAELRRQIMTRLSSYRDEQYERWEMLRSFDEQFAERLRHERCQPLRLSGSLLTAAVPLAIMGAAYWFGGALDALVVGVGLVVPALAYLAVGHVVYLHLHDVTMQEAIKFVERQAAVSKAEAARRLHLPKLFSGREESTGEADEAIEALSA